MSIVFCIFAFIALDLVHCRMTLQGAEGQYISLYCTTFSRSLGPQYPTITLNSTAVIFMSDPCTIPSPKEEFSGKIVYLVKRGYCSDLVVYNNFASIGVLALIRERQR